MLAATSMSLAHTTVNPFVRIGANAMEYSKRLKHDVCSFPSDNNAEGNNLRGVHIMGIHKGDYLKVCNVDFSNVTSNTKAALRLASSMRDVTIEMRLDSPQGEKVAEFACMGIPDDELCTTYTANLQGAVSGVHDVYYVFGGGKLPKQIHFEWCQLSTSVPNPWLWSDVPDPDIIHVGDYYYLVSTTMHLMPGGPIMRSTDLVNWETVSYLFDTLNDTPRYDLKTPETDGTTYGRGQWATSIRYHKGTFWALHSPNDDPHRAFLMKTTDPAKGWTLHARLPHFHDSSLFFDDDDRCYVFSGGGNVRLVELNESMTDIKKGGIDKTLNTRELMPEGLLEGSRVIKKDGYYYLIMVSWPRTGRQQLAYRSKNIEGPYEMKVILKSDFGGFPYVGQGTVVDGKDGEWYGVIFQDRGGVGRVLTLNPVRWADGWPIIGDENGKVPQSMELFPAPQTTSAGMSVVDATSHVSLVHSDEFDSTSTLTGNVPVWQWNHNPEPSMWTLTERPGYLRLKAIPTLPPSGKPSLYHARNTLTQRMEGPCCSGTVSIDITKMQDGDCAGFAAINGHSGIMTIEKNGEELSLVLTHEVVNLANSNKAITGVEREEVARVPLAGCQTVQLRINADFRPVDINTTKSGKDNATFEYCVDGGNVWQQIGGNYRLRFDYTRHFMGSKFAIFNYATKAESTGHIDVDFFHYIHSND